MWISYWRLWEGSRGPQVLGLQECLKALGFSTPKNGVFERRTRQAVCAWQTSRGLAETGIVEPKNFEELLRSRNRNFKLGSAQLLKDGSFPQSYLQVSLDNYRLFLYNHGCLLKSYAISKGKPSTPTPEGNFRILQLWRASNSSLGSRYLSFSPYRHSIHALPPDQEPGKASTIGCLQLPEDDLVELCQYLQVGTPLIISQRHLPPPQESQWTFYYPQRGETPEEICLRYGMGLSQLLACNGLRRKEDIVPGIKLQIPSRGLFASGSADYSHAVEDGLPLYADTGSILKDDLL
jgi:hypothetical protein